jgi:hypothetical protein
MKLPKGFLHRAAVTSLLPQYSQSELMNNRFFEAAHVEDQEVDRAVNIKGVRKEADAAEIAADNLEYFARNKVTMEADFVGNLAEQITKEKADLFCNTISQFWSDGYQVRNGTPMQQLLASVRDYLLSFLDTPKPFVQQDAKLTEPANFSIFDIQAILDLNKEMLYQYLHEWMRGHPNYLELTLGDLYCRRGLYLDSLIDAGNEYTEYAYINSYSLTTSVPEKFAQIKETDYPSIIHTRYERIRERILFFGPFIPGMPDNQLEFGVIPGNNPQTILYDGKHAGMYEYRID